MKVYDDRIEFPTYTISNHPEGIKIDGTFKAVEFKPYPPPMSGTVAGYISGNWVQGPSVQKFPFATEFNSSTVGTLTVARESAAGQSSTLFGYTSGGFNGPFPYLNVIDKFPFAIDYNVTDVGDLTLGRTEVSGQSSYENGYTSAGSPGPTSITDKFPFASDTNAVFAASLTQILYFSAGQSSAESGYVAGTMIPSYTSNIIDKFPFAADTTATDVGDLTVARAGAVGQSSTTHGYASGGFNNLNNPGNTNIIDKFPFATDTNATDVGDLTDARSIAAGQSSTTSGYTSGGQGSFPLYELVDKFPFATDSNASFVGNLTSRNAYRAAGQQD